MDNYIDELDKSLMALGESEDILRYIIKHIPAAVAIFDCDMNYLAVSRRFLLDYNIKDTTIIGKNHYDVFPEIPQRWRDVHQRCLKGEILCKEDDYFERLDGSITYSRWECRPFCRRSGEIGGIILYTEVYTQRKMAELTLKENEKKYRYLFLNNPQPMWLYDLSRHTIIDVNDAAVQNHGYTREQFLQMTLENINPSEEICLLINSIEQGVALNNWSDGIKHIKKNGEILYAEITPYPVKSNGVDVCHILIKDITSRRKAEKALHDSESKHRSFFENSMDAILYTIPDGAVLAANSAACHMLGYTEQEMIKLGRVGLVDMTDPRLPVLLTERRLKGKARGELTFIHKNGTRLETEISSSIFLDHEGFERAHIIFRDVTEKKKAQKVIKFQADLLNNVGEAVIALNDRYEVIYWNKAAEKIYGWTATEAIGKPAVELIPAIITQEQSNEIFRELCKGNTWSGEMVILKKDRSPLQAYITNAPLFDSKGELNGMIGTSIDITERKRTEQTLMKLSSAVEQTIDEVIITDKEGRIEYVNKAYESITGYTLEEVLSQTPWIPRSDNYGVKFYEDLWETILSGNVFRAEVLDKKKNGELYYVEKTISPIFDENRNITHFVSTGVDISARKQVEQELIKAKEKAEESDRLKSAFLANMSHEVRTPLNGIIGFASLLLDADFGPDQKEEFVDRIIKSSNALLSIINDILDISTIEVGKMNIQKIPVDLRAFIISIHQQYIFQVNEKGMELMVNLPEKEDVTILLTDPARLGQVFINLISNALKFTPRGRIDIGYQCSNNEVVCYVRDTGIGIANEYQEKIFDRFRQVEGATTRKYGGNGLGLAITKNLVELMGGRIWVESTPGVGSTFYFTLPRMEG